MHKKILNQKHLRLASFFDDESDMSIGFWEQNQLQYSLKDLTPTAGQFFFKKSKKKVGESKRVYICLVKRYLILAKNKEWSRKYKSLDLSNRFVTLRRLNNLNGAFRFGFTLTYNKKQIELFSKDYEEMNNFLYQLKKYVVQNNFEDIYIMKDKLGSGSYAAVKLTLFYMRNNVCKVHLLEDKVTRTKYAGKVFNLASLPLKNTHLSKTAIKNEAIIQRQMDHENIAKLFEVYETESKVILVIEYIHGKRLLDYVVEHGAFSEKKSILLIKQLVDAVTYIHSAGFIHRDIKLENVMVTTDEGRGNTSNKHILKILDFGLAVENDNVDFLKRSGTPGYVAPEVFSNEKYTNKIDVFSLGVILYTLLSGRSPFVGPDRKTVLLRNRRCEYTFKNRHWHNKSTNAKDLVRRMMEGDPERRIESSRILEHPWFKLVYLNGILPLINLPRMMVVSNTHIFAGTRAPSQTLNSHSQFHFPITKKKSVSETTFTEAKQGTGRRKSTLDTNYSSKRIPNYPNLLQIPPRKQSQNPNFLGVSVNTKESIEVSSIEDGLNKISLQSFYRNTSTSNYDSRSGSELSPTGRRGPLAKSNTLDDEIALENPDMKDKLSSYKGLDNSPKPSSNVDWSHNLPTLSGIPETKEDKLSHELTNDSMPELLAQYPKTQGTFKALSKHLKTRPKLI